MDTLYIAGLGPPQIALNGKAVEIKRRKAVALLVYLAVEGRSRSREFLSGLFWPEYNQSRAYANLRRNLWEIKDALGDGWLETSREWIGIHSSMDIRTDVHQFHTLLQEVKDHDHPFAAPDDHCINLLEDAIHLYRGDFLSGFSVSDCPQFDDWQFCQSEIIRRTFRESIQYLVNALEKRGRIKEAISYGQRWLAFDNLEESAHRKLMTLFAKDGQIHASLRQFESCQYVLKKELDLAPAIETTNLYQRIRKNRASLSSPEAGERNSFLIGGSQSSWLEQILSAPVQIALQTNLPVQRTPFIGRESEIMDVCGLLQNPDCWLLTLTGMGGIGKTRLANQVGQEIRASFPNGVYFVPLEGLKSISAMVPRVAETLGLSFHPKEGSLDTQLHSYLRDKKLLIIFDNFEAFISGAAILNQLHADAAGIKFLVTSRYRLNISGEWVYEIQGLDYPETDLEEIDEILRFPAVELFIHASRRTSKQFQLTEGNCQDIVAIIQFLEGMPLGLEMAASWINLLSPTEILAEIRSSLDFLQTEIQDIPTRQRSMRAILDYSWNHLNGDEQSALARMSVFQSRFTRESAEKVAGVTLSDLKKFMDRSFLRREDSGGFHLHELMRQYALEKLFDSSEECRFTHDRHAAYYCVALYSWGDALKGPEQVELLPEIRREIDNIQAAWTWVTKEKQIEQIRRGVEGLCYFYLRTLRNQEGLSTCQLGLSALEGVNTESQPEIWAKLLSWMSIFYLNLNDSKMAVESIDFCLEIMHACGENKNDFPLLLAKIFMIKAVIENYLGNRESAIEFYDRANDLFQQLRDFSGFSYLMMRALDIGAVVSEKNYQYLSRAIQFTRRSGDLFNTAYLLNTYCQVLAYHLDQPVQAEVLMQEGCKIFAKIGDPLSKEMSLVTVDSILNSQGRYDELLEVREKKLAYARERGDRQTTGVYLSQIGKTLCHLGNYSAAEDYSREALIHLQDGTPYQYALRLCSLGEVLLVQGRISESTNIFKESIHGLEIGEKWGQGKAFAGLSVAAFKAGNQEKAWEMIRKALQRHDEAHTHFFSHFSLGAYAYLLSEKGDILTAIKIYAMLDRQKFVRDSVWFNDLYRIPIYAAALNSKLVEITEVESKGRSMNLWKTLEQILQSKFI